MRRMYDASVPPQAAPPGYDVCAFYIGGDTPHRWSDEERTRQGARHYLPIWTRFPTADYSAADDAAMAVAWMRDHAVPHGAALALDFETGVDAAYVETFDVAVTSAGYSLILYGSLSFVLQNPRPRGGYWTAIWDGNPQLRPGDAAATQYAQGSAYDSSIVSDSLVLWDGKPNSSVTPPPVPGADEPSGWTDYTVVAGDNLSVIAARHGTTWEELWRRNPQITDPDLIHPGDVIDVPSPVAPSPPESRPRYTVVSGDSLSVIAARHGLTLAQIEALNPQFSANFDLIHPGDVVYLG